MQSGYLLVKGLLKKKASTPSLFNALDELFEIPKESEKPIASEEDLIKDFERYIGV